MAELFMATLYAIRPGGALEKGRAINWSASSLIPTDPATGQLWQQNPGNPASPFAWWAAFPNPTCGGQWCTMDNEPGWLTELASLGKQAAQVAERAAKTGQGVLIVQAAGNDSDLFCSPPNLPTSPCTSPSQLQEIRARN